MTRRSDSDEHVCTTCWEMFSVPVWECRKCGHHNHKVNDAECRGCHLTGRPGRPPKEKKQ